jgi:hypothetical protein
MLFFYRKINKGYAILRKYSVSQREILIRFLTWSKRSGLFRPDSDGDPMPTKGIEEVNYGAHLQVTEINFDAFQTSTPGRVELEDPY